MRASSLGTERQGGRGRAPWPMRVRHRDMRVRHDTVRVIPPQRALLLSGHALPCQSGVPGELAQD